MRTFDWADTGSVLRAAMESAPDLAIEACYIGPEAGRRLAQYARTWLGHDVVLVADENTRQAGGDPVVAALDDAGRRPHEVILPGDGLDATEERARELATAAEAADFLVAVGAGTVCDLAKQAGTWLEKPVLLYPTAASMNGYTSGITALKVRGLKRTIPCTPAAGVFADPAIAAGAPQRMAAAGLADFLSKCSASADWRAAHFLRGAWFDPDAMRFYEGAVDAVLHAAPNVGEGDPHAVGVTLEALLLSGLSMLAAGSSSPASGGEHLISHYIDMKAALDGTPHDLHGAQVGVATVHCLDLWQRIVDSDPADFDTDILVARQPDPDALRGDILADWGEVADEVWNQWQAKALDPTGLHAEIDRIRAEFHALRAEVEGELLPPGVVADAIRAAGGPVDAAGLEVEPAVYERALRHARYLRDRFTVLDLAAELGLEG